MQGCGIMIEEVEAGSVGAVIIKDADVKPATTNFS